MILTEQIFAQALLLAGELEQRQEVLLQVLCRAAANELGTRLRDGLSPQDCKSDFIGAASLLALAALSECDELGSMESVRIGDVTVKKGEGNAAANCLRRQAALILAPYRRDEFSFQGV